MQNCDTKSRGPAQATKRQYGRAPLVPGPLAEDFAIGEAPIP